MKELFSKKHIEVFNQFKWLVLILSVMMVIAIFSVFISPLSSVDNSHDLGFGSSTPTRLSIPAIGVDSIITNQKLTEEGAVPSPEDPDVVTWFNGSPIPGEEGSSIISGHFGYKNGIKSVFDDLHKLKIGDEIQVQDFGKGVKTFVVREIKIYDAILIVDEVFNSSDGKAHLNLITCSGSWNKKKDSYESRLVVFADQVI